MILLINQKPGSDRAFFFAAGCLLKKGEARVSNRGEMLKKKRLDQSSQLSTTVSQVIRTGVSR